MQSPPLWAAANTNSSRSQTQHSLSHRNLGRKGQRKADQNLEIYIHVYSTYFFFWLWFGFTQNLHQEEKSLGSSVLPSALNICIPPYFPSKSTVLFRRLNARHIRTKTTSKQPGRSMETECNLHWSVVWVEIQGSYSRIVQIHLCHLVLLGAPALLQRDAPISCAPVPPFIWLCLADHAITYQKVCSDNLSKQMGLCC